MSSRGRRGGDRGGGGGGGGGTGGGSGGSNPPQGGRGSSRSRRPRGATASTGGPSRGHTPRGPASPRPSAAAGPSSSAAPAPARGRSSSRGSGLASSSQQAAAAGIASSFQAAPLQVQTVGFPRPSFAKEGCHVNLQVNAFPVTYHDSYIYHYDVALLRSNNKPDGPVSVELMTRLQSLIAPNVFTPRVSFDGKRNLYAAHFLFDQDEDLDQRTFDVPLQDPVPGGGPPGVCRVQIKRANKANATVLAEHAKGRRPWDDDVQMALQAFNVTLRSSPIVTQQYPFKGRSFYVDDNETRRIGRGIELWRGYFQSFRMGIGRAIVNVDISTGIMYKRGPLIGTALEFLRGDRLVDLTPGMGLTEHKRIDLQTFLSGCHITAPQAGHPNNVNKRTIQKVSKQSARDSMFDRGGVQTSVANYWSQMSNGQPLQYPDLPCVEVSDDGEMIPFEKCTVSPGQALRIKLPEELTSEMVNFARMDPPQRLNSIVAGLSLMNYDQSEYLTQFGMAVQSQPVRVQGLLISPPGLKYGEGSKDTQIMPRFGAWNMIDKKFVSPVSIGTWIIVSFDDRRFKEKDAQKMSRDLVRGMNSVGIRVQDTQPKFYIHSPQSNIVEVLHRDVDDCRAKKRSMPQLVVVILPDGGNDVWTAVKHWGDVLHTMPTQCLKSNKATRANMQYWANVCLKINAKLGGINSTLDPMASNAAKWLSDPVNPTLVMGADVMHPPPNVDKPSYAALVGSVDANVSQYVADLRLNETNVEPIAKFRDMAKGIIQEYIRRRENENKHGDAAHPKRILFYRDGVDEGQFKIVKNKEIKELEKVLRELKINAKITFIIVGKRHHMRFFPQQEGDQDRRGNCLAGTLIDQVVTHPTDQDFYLYSHAGIIGTSRPSHYSVLRNDNQLSTDALAAISFALCHVYTRCTRSVSIPAPVYYADIVCSRAKNHFDPTFDLSTMYSQSSDGHDAMMKAYRKHFKRPDQVGLMFFSCAETSGFARQIQAYEQLQ